ncbi:uncharacterized protein LOC108914427 [Anoplophora glabripennis]|uniref:uncharacterized protein LOC108914427 n=1 Tax=Anoplophora glabripennis TaxID=217634 RepID=UPI000873BB97|nr:uncharacterized protein LOC108914427 [Anoplophora glabripennis]
MSFYTPVCVALLGVSALFVQCLDLSEEFKKHSSMVARANFPCKVPQPRVFYLEDLVSATEWNNSYQGIYEIDNVLPKWTILYRCTSSGCCVEKDKRCLPSGMDELNVTFSSVTERIEYFQIPVTNHTQCSCLSTDNSGKSNIK